MPVVYRIPGEETGSVEFHAKKAPAAKRLTKIFGRRHGKSVTAIKINGRDKLCTLLNNPAIDLDELESDLL